MSKKSDELIQESLENRWSTTSNPNAASSCVCASPTPAFPSGKMNVDAITYSIVNQTAAAVQNTISLRSSAQSGSVLAQIRVLVPTAQSVQFNGAIQLPGKQGQLVSADITPAAGSVLQNVTLTGWQQPNR
jgi:hypothetical protein